MFKLQLKKAVNTVTTLSLIFAALFAPLSYIQAADHAESTTVSKDPGADIADVYTFLSPNDNSKVVLAMTFDGFLLPSQALNLGFFSPDVVYLFEIENTGDTIPDRFIDVTFSPQTSRSAPQTATVVMFGGGKGFRGMLSTVNFTAPTTVPNILSTAPPFVVTTNQASGISAFAGLTDDPFYFDIPAFNRFVNSVNAGMPNAATFQRGRDSFAGYNIHTIALEVPANLLRGSVGNIGINGVTLRERFTVRQNTNGQVDRFGDLVQVDRMGVPAVNTALIPFPRKNEFNAATPKDDAAGLFANSIVATLTSFGTNQQNIGILASVAVTNGDYLRLSLSTPNTNQGFGERVTTPNYTGFPNGRRLGDDTIDVLLYFISNQALTSGDNVNSNEVPLTDTFPFFGRPHQPLENPAVDDRTRN